MNRLLRTAVVLITSFALVACTSLRVVSDGQSASADALRTAKPAVKPKDELVITTSDGRRYELRVTSVDSTAIKGIVEGQPTVIPIDEIERIERVEVDGNKVVRAGLIYVFVSVILGLVLGRVLTKDLFSK